MNPYVPSALAGGGPALNPLAAALMQGAMPNQSGASAGAPPAPLLQTGGPVPGSIPIGAPANQFGTIPGPLAAPPAAGAGAPGLAQPPTPIPHPMPAPAPALGPAAVRPFGFGGLRPQGY